MTSHLAIQPFMMRFSGFFFATQYMKRSIMDAILNRLETASIRLER
jgi:hypothetical protein